MMICKSKLFNFYIMFYLYLTRKYFAKYRYIIYIISQITVTYVGG